LIATAGAVAINPDFPFRFTLLLSDPRWNDRRPHAQMNEIEMLFRMITIDHRLYDYY